MISCLKEYSCLRFGNCGARPGEPTNIRFSRLLCDAAILSGTLSAGAFVYSVSSFATGNDTKIAEAASVAGAVYASIFSGVALTAYCACRRSTKKTETSMV